MIARCGLNVLKQYPVSLTRHLRNSKKNPKLLQALVQLDEVQHSGSPLGPDEKAWALQNGIKLRVNIISSITFNCR